MTNSGKTGTMEAPENVRIPDFEDVITPFERMCLVKALREDRTQVAAQAYIADAIGQQFVESVPLNIEATWEESTPYVPIICLLSPGSDPTKLIEELAKRQKITVNGVSMGQGQEIIAREANDLRHAGGTLGVAPKHPPRLGLHG